MTKKQKKLTKKIKIEQKNNKKKQKMKKLNQKSTKKIKKLTKKNQIIKKIKNVPKTKLDTISLFRNDLELVPKRREPQQRPLSPRYETSS